MIRCKSISDPFYLPNMTPWYLMVIHSTQGFQFRASNEVASSTAKETYYVVLKKEGTRWEKPRIGLLTKI